MGTEDSGLATSIIHAKVHTRTPYNVFAMFFHSSGSPKPSSGGTQRSNTSLSKVRPLIYGDSLELMSNPGSTKSSRKPIHPIDGRDVQAFEPVKSGLPLYFANGALEEMADNLNTIDRDGLSALHRAVRVNNIQDVKNMLDYGADVNLKDKDGFTPIHTAVRYLQFYVWSK